MSVQVDLEVLTHAPANGQGRPTPLLFVHGAYASARLWSPFFLPFFARHGYDAHAVSVRGHGASAGRETVKGARLKDYVADVSRAMDQLPAPPVLIGHSLGGMIVQKILTQRALPGAVLMCSAPPHGLMGSTLAAMFGNPVMFRQMSALQKQGPDAATLDGARRAPLRRDHGRPAGRQHGQEREQEGGPEREHEMTRDVRPRPGNDAPGRLDGQD